MKGRVTGESYDAVVIGGGVGGLVAATYIARARARVLLVEAQGTFGGRAKTVSITSGFKGPYLDHSLLGLDPQVIQELGLFQHGLSYLEGGAKLIALRPGGDHILLPAGSCRAKDVVVSDAKSDSRAYVQFRRELLRFARHMRPLWLGEPSSAGDEGREIAFRNLTARLPISPRELDRLEAFSRQSAAAYLDRWFESDALKAAIAFDACAGGLAPHEAGSALMLLWKQVQTIAWGAGVAAQARGGPGGLGAALKAVAVNAGVDLRAGTRALSIAVENGRVLGVTLEDGTMHGAGNVLSSLPLRETLLDLIPASEIGFGLAASLPAQRAMATAKMLLALKGPPPIPGLSPQDLTNRFIVAERSEAADEAKGAALLGRMPEVIVMEGTTPTAADPDLAPAGCHVMSLLVPLLPENVEGGWEKQKDALGKRIIVRLETFAPGLKDRVLAVSVLTPQDIAAQSGTHSGQTASPLQRLLSSYEARIRTPFAGLFLCGSSAEPVSGICGRAGRIAARLALAGWRQQQEGTS